MKKQPHTQPNQGHGTMMNQKTYEDFNKEKPDPKDPNQQEHHPEIEVPVIGNNTLPPAILPKVALVLMTIFFSSCEAIAGIFKAGMGVGAFAVIFVIILVVGLLVRLLSSKK